MFTRFNCAMGLLVVILVLADILLARTVQLEGLTYFFHIWPTLAILIACLIYSYQRPLPRLIGMCELAIWAVLLFNALSVLTQVAARTSSPLMDGALSALDSRLNFTTASVVHLVRRIPVLNALSTICYISLNPFVPAVVLFPPIFGRLADSRRFVLAVVFSAIVTAVAFAFWPAVGPWTVQDFRPTGAQAAVNVYLLKLKASGPVALDMNDYTIVSFPSYHTVLAILCATVTCSFSRLRVWGWLFAVAICITTVTTGWHYLADVIGGLILAAISILVARWAEKLLSRGDPTIRYDGSGS